VERVSEELSKLAKDVETRQSLSTASILAGDTADRRDDRPRRWTRSARKAHTPVEESNTFGLELELTELRFDKGYISPDVSTDP